MKLHFGPYRGVEVADVPRDYLLWLVAQPWLRSRLKSHVEDVLMPDNGCCIGPSWWYRQRKNVARTARDG
jgi:hypothetical protein